MILLRQVVRKELRKDFKFKKMKINLTIYLLIMGFFSFSQDTLQYNRISPIAKGEKKIEYGTIVFNDKIVKFNEKRLTVTKKYFINNGSDIVYKIKDSKGRKGMFIYYPKLMSTSFAWYWIEDKNRYEKTLLYWTTDALN